MRSSIVMLFAFAATLAYAGDEPEWREFASKQGRFKVLMPGTPRQDKARLKAISAKASCT
jgi:hypothetical protein